MRDGRTLNSVWLRYSEALERYSAAGQWPQLAEVDRKLALLLKQHGPKLPGTEPAYDRLAQTHQRAMQRLQQHLSELKQQIEQQQHHQAGLRAYHQIELIHQREHSFY